MTERRAFDAAITEARVPQGVRLDPVGRREVTGLLHELSGRNKTILISSHILYEVEQMTRNILLIRSAVPGPDGGLVLVRSSVKAKKAKS